MKGKEFGRVFNIDKNQRVILFVGRFTEKKGIRLIKSAIEKTSGLPLDSDRKKWG